MSVKKFEIAGAVSAGLLLTAAALYANPAAAQSAISINSTAQLRAAGIIAPVKQPALTGDGAHRVLVANDLGMHCADLDSRIASILPPFNVLHAQVLKMGARPVLMSKAGASVFYAAASNPTDPALANAPVLAANGNPFKSNAGGKIVATYAPLYPPGLLATFFPATSTRKGDLGLPVPDLAQLYLGNGALSFNQATMPSVTASAFDKTSGVPVTFQTKPYVANTAQPFRVFDASWPMFTKLPFGYVAPNVNWFAAEGIPMAPSADPAYGTVLPWVSEEWAADVNIVRLHDRKHGTKLFTGYNAVTGIALRPVLCQTCHYSPALDLAQGGPQSGNGLEQTLHETMSRVMHNNHGLLQVNGTPLFPLMPPPDDPRRSATPGAGPDNAFTESVLQATCYQCHPGQRTKCLRGTMFSNAGSVCQDCHGQMTQVGNDFSRKQPGGGFQVAGDFYTNPATPRVPWANEPGCGSCHTGDAVNNMTGKPGTIASVDNIRLIQAFLSTDTKATPIVPANARFAEPRVLTGPAAGNPQLFRLSVDKHGGVFCEGCHGSTHAEWPVGNPNANDNIAAMQLQGHTGKILECETCHTGTMAATLAGPHGMHPVGNKGNTASWVRGHGDFAEGSGVASCQTCHGKKGEGTVLAKVAVARTGLSCGEGGGSLCKGGTVTLAAATEVSCGLCHANPVH